MKRSETSSIRITKDRSRRRVFFGRKMSFHSHLGLITAALLQFLSAMYRIDSGNKRRERSWRLRVPSTPFRARSCSLNCSSGNIAPVASPVNRRFHSRLRKTIVLSWRGFPTMQRVVATLRSIRGQPGVSTRRRSERKPVERVGSVGKEEG